jgi:hypothetical protein
MKTCNASRVIAPRSEVRSANLVGDTKVDRGNRWFPQMCVRRPGERINSESFSRVKSPLMPFAQKANHHDAIPLDSA